MRVDHYSIAWALKGGHAYYMGDRLMAALPPRHDRTFPDVCVISPCGETSPHFEVIAEWWRAEHARDVAASWNDADFSAQASRTAQDAWERLIDGLCIVRIGEAKRMS